MKQRELEFVLKLTPDQFIKASKLASDKYKASYKYAKNHPIPLKETGGADMLKRIASIGAAYLILKNQFSTFIDFQSRMANVASLGVKNIGELNDAVLEMGKETPVALNDLSAGLYDVVSAGVDANNQIQVLETSARAAKAGLAETSDALNLGSGIIKAYGLEWDAMGDIMDKAFQTVKLGQTTFPDLAKNLGAVTPLAATLKIETKELFGAFATLTGVTGNTSEVATQLRGIMAAMAKPTENLVDLVQKYGYSTVEAAVAQEGLIGMLNIIKQETGGSATEMGKLIPRVEGMNAALALSGEQFQTFIDKTQAMQDSTGAMGDAFDIQSETMESRLQVLSNRWDALTIALLNNALPAITTIVDLLADTIEFIDSLDKETIIFIGTIGGLALAFAKLPVLIYAVRTAFLSLNAALGPAGWIALGLTAVVVAFDVLSESTKELAEKNKQAAKETMGLIEAEKKRVEQAIETKTATDEEVKSLIKLNDELIRQQKIISDANIAIYKEELEGAADDFEDLMQGIYDHFTHKAPLIKKLFDEYGKNFEAMEEKVSERMTMLSDKLLKHQLGLIDISGKELKNLNNELDAYKEMMPYLQTAAEAQRNLNDELENRKRLLDEMPEIDESKTVKIKVEQDISEFEPDTSGIERAELPEDEGLDIDDILPPDVPEKYKERYQYMVETGRISLDTHIENTKKALEIEQELHGNNTLRYMELQDELIAFENQKADERIAIQMRVINAIQAGMDILSGFAGFAAEGRQAEAEANRQRLQETVQARENALQKELEQGRISKREYKKRLDEIKKYEQQQTKNIEAESKKRSGIEIANRIAQITMSTYTMATKAYEAMAGIPVIGPTILAPAAAAAAIALGLANLAKVKAVGYAKGGYIGPGDVFQSVYTPPGDHGLIGAQVGEMVMNRRATTMFRDDLEEKNRIGRGRSANRSTGYGYSEGGEVKEVIQIGQPAMQTAIDMDLIMTAVERGIINGFDNSTLEVAGILKAKGADLESAIAKREELKSTY